MPTPPVNPQVRKLLGTKQGQELLRQAGKGQAQYLVSRLAGFTARATPESGDKVTRAEPVAALYEQGRVSHLRGLQRLEDQMCRMTSQGYEGRGSPDRVDALVWALTELIVEPAQKALRPQVRVL